MLISDSKLPVGVNVNDCLSLYYKSALLLTGDLSRVYPPPLAECQLR